MRVGIIFVFMDFHRKGGKYHGVLQPLIGPLVAGLLPQDIEIEVVNDTWEDPPWERDYDLLFITGMHSDFDRARQVSHYWRRRGAKTVLGGTLASTYPELCQPFFDAVVVGDAEGSVPQVYRDFAAGELQPLYVSAAYDPALVPVPRFDLLAGKQMIPLSFEATRGCPFTCEFCALTGIGTRHHVRPVESILRDIREGQRMLRGLVPWYLLDVVGFLDNNLGGNPGYLRQLCQAMEPLGLTWGSGITFNVLADEGMVQALSRAGCRAMFMGLESLNPATIKDMHKYQNTVAEARRVLDLCRRHGILVESPLMLSPVTDDLEYIQSIPDRLRECGLYVPTFVCIESPIPGTPHFHRLAGEGAAFLPNALLRDFTATPWSPGPSWSRWRLHPGLRLGGGEHLHPQGEGGAPPPQHAEFLRHGFFSRPWRSARPPLHKRLPSRPHLPHGTDVPFPGGAGVPLTDDDFDSEEERRAILEPWRVTDPQGRVLPAWQRSVKVFEGKGRISAEARQLVAIA